ncbi:ADP-ribosylation factor GTPase-activating protein 2 [Octopus bimaculoides]|uniref:Arf-GAP domain-containing protein n=1 Tax=Octopus bimaculoides TaxID=37653 RepID=A0A0L8FSG8_OCTBM|nr:ADP-ribosylation factor GTPase-activating protein 2 [Octopus bimaculoides]|eukprot:XP_014787350.1 PREDICTED: ADP-ribosylation factor GTPase-activating protein 2-like [Octopus bimaculoides]
MAEQPSKTDISAVFKRLKSIPCNKQCFDCGSNNPTWASVTYGVFLCIDCSAVHRSLGVHVSFIRSSQLDTNWTWLQLRTMQVGGNGNAISFFRQHGCTTNDTQQKYHSRAANLYRERLLTQAQNMMKLHKSKLHLDNTSHMEEEPTPPKEVDFFEEVSDNILLCNNSTNGITDSSKAFSETLIHNNNNVKLSATKLDTDTNVAEGPNVDIALSLSSNQTEPRKSVLTAKKTSTSKKGKGGLGAQRVKTNFTEIESRAQRMDKEKEDLEALRNMEQVRNKAEEERQIASMKLAYQDMKLERKKEEEKLKSSDPQKAAQLERLGMGFSGSRGVSHSILSDMTVIDQETPSGRTSNSSNLDRFESSQSGRDFFEDEFDKLGGFSLSSKYRDGMFGSSSGSSSSNSKWGYSNRTGSWDVDRFETKTSFTDPVPSYDDSDKPSRNRKVVEVETSSTAQNKFGNAKSISSDQFFGPRDPAMEHKATLSKFAGNSSISSDDFFGRTSRGSNSDSGQYSGTDLSDIKEGVRQGVTKVAGKLSSLANGVMSSLQEKYGS